jgi:hypothetical protein
MTKEIETKPLTRLKSNGTGRPRNKVLTRKSRKQEGRPVNEFNYKFSGIRTRKRTGPPRYALPFTEARAIVQNEHLGSRNDFLRWWNFNIPARIPKNPARTYCKEGWVSWGDFLGIQNEYPNKKKNYREFHEARNYARSLKLKIKAEWFELAKSGRLPPDIPLHPNLAYGRTIKTGKPKRGGHWVSWKDWLGATLADHMIAIREKLNVVAVIKLKNMPGNVFAFMALNGFEHDIKQKLSDPTFHVIKIYEPNKMFDWGGYLSSRYHNYYEMTGAYFINNINEVIYIFDMQMDIVQFNRDTNFFTP